MPELPEVEGFKEVLKNSLGQKIRTVEVHNSKVLDHISDTRFRNKLKGATLVSAQRYGKYLFGKTDHDFWVSFHFGMTGFLRICGKGEKAEKHERVIFRFENEAGLSFSNKRLFGRVGIVKSPSQFSSDHKLGTDALKISRNEYFSILEQHSVAVKTFLMNQERIAGIGNEYSDEILFQARIHPGKNTDELSSEQKKNLFHQIKSVLSDASRSRRKGKQLPEGYLINVRGKNKSCPRCGTPITSEKFGGRTGYFCPKCQV
ncbi:MAG: Fpg/Nei family DNA glycosylase [Chitinispirillaceae bacterium]